MTAGGERDQGVILEVASFVFVPSLDVANFPDEFACFPPICNRWFLNRTTLNGKCFTSKAGKWNNLSQSSEVKRWTESIFA
jgi:hypothetical protein